MERFTSYESFIAFCQKHQVPHRFDNAHHLVELPNTATPLPSTTVVKFDKQLPLLTFVQFMADNLPDDRIADLEAAISRLNTVLEIGGFCIDYDLKRLLARFSITLFPNEGISAVAFQRTFELVVGNARGVLPVLKKIIDGAPGKDVVQIAREHVAAQNAATPPTSS